MRLTPPRLTSLVLALLLSACAQSLAVHDLEGRRIGQPDWRPILSHEARLEIVDNDAAVLAREKINLPSRYLERWTIEGGHLVYEVLAEGGFGPESEGRAYLQRLYGEDPVLRERGIRIIEADIQIRKELTFLVAHSDKITCFVFVSIFGESRFVNSPGDRLLRGGICRPVQSPEASENEPNFIQLLASLRADGVPVLVE